MVNKATKLTPEASNWIDSYRMDAQEANRIANKTNTEGTEKTKIVAEKYLAKAFKKIEKAANKGQLWTTVKTCPLFAKQATRKYCFNFCTNRLKQSNFQITGDYTNSGLIFIEWR